MRKTALETLLDLSDRVERLEKRASVSRPPSKMEVLIQINKRGGDRTSLDGRSVFFLGYDYDAYLLLKKIYPQYEVSFRPNSLTVKGGGFSHTLKMEKVLPEMYEIR